MQEMRLSRLVVLLSALLLCTGVSGEFRIGDLVPASRRGQFHGVRLAPILAPT